AQCRAARLFDGVRRFKDLRAALDRARPGDQRDLLVADAQPVQRDARALRAHLQAGDLVGGEDAHAALDARQPRHLPLVERAVVADHADDGALLTRRQVRLVALALNPLDDRLNVVLRRLARHDDDHDWSPLCWMMAKSGRRASAPRRYTCWISAWGRRVFQWMSTRMARSSAPGTATSCTQNSGTITQPSSRAATAGCTASRSGVRLKIALAMSAVSMPLTATICSSISRVASRIASRVFAAATVAPRTPRHTTALSLTCPSAAIVASCSAGDPCPKMRKARSICSAPVCLPWGWAAQQPLLATRAMLLCVCALKVKVIDVAKELAVRRSRRAVGAGRYVCEHGFSSPSSG